MDDENPLLRRATDHLPGTCTGGCAEIKTMATQLKDRDERTTRIEMMIEQNCKDTAEALDIVRLGKSFFRVAGHIGNFVKWTASILMPLVALWFLFKDHNR